MAGFATRSRFAGHPNRSDQAHHALRLNPDHPMGAGPVLTQFCEMRLGGSYKQVRSLGFLRHVLVRRWPQVVPPGASPPPLKPDPCCTAAASYATV